jgi:NADH:ubiquinone oxidoreductase subunit 3 (subunit A)
MLIIIIAAAAGALVLVMVILAVVVSRRRKSKTANIYENAGISDSTPITKDYDLFEDWTQ